MPWIQSRKKSSGGGGTPIPYIAANANQLVTLPFYSDDYPYITARLMTIAPLGQQVIIGDIWDVNGFVFLIENNDWNNLYLRYITTAMLPIPTVKWCEPVDVELDYTNGSIKYDGILYTGAPKTQLHNIIKLFGQNATTRRGMVFIFELKVYINSVLAMHLIPMKDTNTGAGYLHDTIGNQDYYSETTAPLIYGIMQGNPLPAEPYIYNTGSAGFNTGHIHTANTKVIFKACASDTSSYLNAYGQVFGARSGNAGNSSFGLFTKFNNNRKYCFYRTGQEIQGDVVGTASSTSTPFTNDVCIFTATGQTCSWYRADNPSDVHSLTAPSSTVNGGTCPIALFCGNTSTTQGGWQATDMGCMRLYWFEIYESDVLVHRFVPAYNNEQYCLYDEVDETYIYDVVRSGENVRGQVN